MKKGESAYFIDFEMETCSVIVGETTGRTALLISSKEAKEIALVVDLEKIQGLRSALSKAEEYLLTKPGTA